MVQANGSNGQVLVDGDVVVITRKGVGARVYWGNTPPKRIPIASITSVQMGRLGLTGLIDGYIRFVIIGNVESGPVEESLERDPNTVLYVRVSKIEADFERVRAAVETRIINRANPPLLGLTPSASLSRVDQLRSLAELRDSGVLTQEEFELEKSRLLRSKSELSESEYLRPVGGPSGVKESADHVRNPNMRELVNSFAWASSPILIRCGVAICTFGLSELAYWIYRKYRKSKP